MGLSLIWKFVFSIALLMLASASMANIDKIRTSFGSCPARSAGSFVLKLSKDYEGHRSLLKLKMRIVHEELMQRHYISEYTIKFNPITDSLSFNLDCADAIAKIHSGKAGSAENFEGILVQGGKIFDPVYEMLLRDSKKLNIELPVVSVVTEKIDEARLSKIAEALQSLPADVFKVVSEIILDDNSEIMVIVQNDGIKNPTSFFLNDENMNSKFQKLTQLVRYFQEQKAQPAVVNMRNEKKVVVKFGN